MDIVRSHTRTILIRSFESFLLANGAQFSGLPSDLGMIFHVLRWSHCLVKAHLKISKALLVTDGSFGTLFPNGCDLCLVVTNTWRVVEVGRECSFAEGNLGTALDMRRCYFW